MARDSASRPSAPRRSADRSRGAAAQGVSPGSVGPPPLRRNGATLRKVGVIDVGSNTSRLVVLAYRPGVAFRLVDQVREQVRLGEGMGAENLLRAEPMERALRLLRVFRGLCDGNGIDVVLAVGTSAVRDAHNQSEFLRRVEEGAGLSLRVLSGDEEAYYGYLGASIGLGVSDGLVLDIGGGSLELVRVEERRPRRSVMLPAGAVRLTETFLRKDPPKPAEVSALRRYLVYLLRDLPWATLERGAVLVGTGGTIRTLAKIDQRLEDYPLDRLHGYVLGRDRVERIVRSLIKLPLRKRRKLPGLGDERADVIAAGALALLAVMKRCGCEAVQVSGQGLREGLFYEHFLKESGRDDIEDRRAFGVANLSLLYDLNWPHARHVQALATSLFDQLRPLHGYGGHERAVLSAAALLHDLGLAIDYYRHHEYSASIILDADLPGFDHRDIALMSQLVLYHRRGVPDPAPFPGLLTPADRERIEKLAALLRLAEYLERSRTQAVQTIRCRVQPRTVTLECAVRGDATTEMWATERKSDLFRQAYRRTLQLKTRASRASAKPPVPEKPDAPLLWRRTREISELLSGGR